MTTRFATFFVTTALGLAILSTPTGAQTEVTWDGDTDTNWVNGDNWSTGVVPKGTDNGSGDIAVFPSALTTNLPTLTTAERKVDGLRFEKPDGGWTISNDGNTLFLGPVGAPVQDLATSGTTTIDGDLLHRGCAFSLNGGTVDVNGALILRLGLKAVSVNDGTVIADSLDLYPGQEGKRYGIGGNGTLEILGAAGANVTGEVLVQGSSVTVVLGHKDALGTGFITSNNDSIFQASTDLTGADAITTELVLKDSATFFSGSHSIELTNVTRFGGGGKSITNDIASGKMLVIANDVTALYENPAGQSGVILSSVYGSGDTILSADLSGPGGINQRGTGVLTLSGNNSYAGITNVYSGVLKLASAGALGPEGLSIRGGGVVGLTAASGDFTRPLASNPTTGQVELRFGNAGFAAYEVDRNVNFGGAGAQIQWNAPFVGNDLPLILGHETADATVTVINPIDISRGSTARVRTFEAKDGTAEIDGRLQGAIVAAPNWAIFEVEKTGAGTLEFAGDNTYIGETFVRNGVLLITGDSSAATGDITVDSGATLGGSGIVGGATAVNGTLAPGASAGELTFAGDVTLDALAALDIDLGGTTAGVDYDVLDVGGILDLGGAVLNVDLIDPFSPQAGDLFDILDWGSLSGAFGDVHLPDLGVGLEWNDAELLNAGVLSVSAVQLAAVPEPVSLILLGLAGLAGLAVRRR